MRLVVLASGQGSNLQALIDRYPQGVVGVFTNHPEAYSLERARQAGIPHWCCVRASGQDRIGYDTELAERVRTVQPDLVVLAGWMHVLSPVFLTGLAVVNLHPAWLPDDPAQNEVVLPDGSISPVFRGAHALRDALSHGVSYVGSTVHWVTAEVDRGPVIRREGLAVAPADTLESLRARLLPIEHRILPDAVEMVLKGLTTRQPI